MFLDNEPSLTHQEFLAKGTLNAPVDLVCHGQRHVPGARKHAETTHTTLAFVVSCFSLLINEMTPN